MSTKTDRGPPPAPPQAGPIGGAGRPTPVMALQGSSAAAAPEPDFGWPPGGQCGSHCWPRCDAVFRDKSRWLAGAAGARRIGLDAEEGVRVMGSSMRAARADTRAGAPS